MINQLLGLSCLCLPISLMKNISLQVKIEKLVTAMGGVLQSKPSLDVSFVIVKNVLAAKYKVG